MEDQNPNEIFNTNISDNGSGDVQQPSFPPPPMTSPVNATIAQTQAQTIVPQRSPSRWAHNTRLDFNEVKRSILEHVQALAKSAGQQVPDDIVRFLENSDIVYLDEHGQPIRFLKAIVTWEDK